MAGREKMLGETVGIEMHLRGCKETLQRKLSKIYESDPNEDSVTGETESHSASISCSQARLPVVGLGFIQLSCWLRASCGDP